MRKIGTFYIGSLSLVIGACSSNNTADQSGGVAGNGATGNGSGTGSANASQGGGYYATQGGAGQVGGAASQGGGYYATQGGAGQVGGAGPNAGGAGQVGGANGTGTGGSTSCGPAACGPDSCSTIIDVCGDPIDCGACKTGSYCNFNGVTPNICTPCAATDCTTAGAECGYLQDGCNTLLNCGTCQAGQSCVANKCTTGGAPACAGFCLQQVVCPVGTSATTLTGTVLAPNGVMPLPNALVYVPNGSTTYPYGVTEFVDGVATNGCECNVSGTPLVQTTTGVDGSFVLPDVPAGTDIPLVIQLGRWRRLITVPSVTQCTITPVDKTLTSLPTRQDMGSTMDAIPLLALSTGAVDAMECVLRKMGIEDSQFSNAGGTGRIQFYRDNGASCTNGGTSACTGTTPGIAQLTATQASVDQYDALIFPCDGAAHNVNAPDKTRILDVATNAAAYVNKGGRAFFTHYSYGWLYNQAPATGLPWISTTNLNTEDGTHHDPTQQVEIDTTFPRGATFAAWLGLSSVNALSSVPPNPPTIAIDESRENVRNPATWNNTLIPIPALRWAFYQNNTPAASILHITFDTPWGAAPADQCGRVLYSSFHVTTAALAGSACVTGTGANSRTSNCNFPGECSTTFTAQEKTLAYFMFDMTSCVAPPPACPLKTCADYNVTCGDVPDGCDGFLHCGDCTCKPQTCEQACPAGQCQTANDKIKFVLPCAQLSLCPDQPTVQCFCPIG